MDLKIQLLSGGILLQMIVIQECISFTDHYPGFKSLMERKLTETRQSIAPVFESENVGTLKRAVESGLGWGFLPAHSIRKQVRAGRIAQVLVEDLRYSVNVNLYYRKDAKTEQMHETFFQALHQQALNT